MNNFDTLINRQNTMSVKWDTVPTDQLPMWVADMDFKCADEIIEALKSRVDHGIYGYLALENSYYDSIINWMKNRHNWEIQKQWIVTTPGIVTAFNIAIQTFTKKGDKIAIQTPVYPPFFSAVKNNGRELVENRLILKDGIYSMDFNSLEESFKNGVKALMLCSPHNPIGRVWSKEELKTLGNLCVKYNVLVISDEIHNDLTFNGKTHTVFSKISQEINDNCIVCTAPSKTFNIAGIQCSNIIIPNDNLREQFVKSLTCCGLDHLNIFSVPALITSYNHCEYWLNDLMIYLEDNFNYLDTFLKENLPIIKATPSQGTYLVWLDFRELNLSQSDLVNLISNNAKVLLNDGSTFGEDGIGFMRLNIGCPRELLCNGLNRIKNAIDKL